MFKRILAAFILVSWASLACAAPVARADAHAGSATFFNPGTGVCGVTNTDQDLMVAVSAQFFNSFGAQAANNPVCGRNIKVTTTASGKSVTVPVEDVCAECASDDILLSPAAFQQITDGSSLVQVTWDLA